MLDIAYPEYLTGVSARREATRWQWAQGCRLLRARPTGLQTSVMAGLQTSGVAWTLLALALGGLCVAAAIMVTVALPGSVGTVFPLIGIAGVVAALWATAWFVVLGRRARNWRDECVRQGAPVPAGRFFTPNQDLRKTADWWLTFLMIVACPMAFSYGPVIGLVSLAHGFRDQAIVSTLRQHGASVMGTIQSETTGFAMENSDGSVTPAPIFTTLEFVPLGWQDAYGGQSVDTRDPEINGWTWPVSKAHVQIVYLPSNPGEAAVAGQLDGSPWRGAPTGNLISGGLLTVSLGPLIWFTIRRIRKSSRPLPGAVVAPRPTEHEDSAMPELVDD
jgi:hypothetical protein